MRLKSRATGLVLRFAVIATVVALTAPVAQAETLAYWRHEEGPAGTRPPHSFNNTLPIDSILDSSAYGNHMRTFADFTAPLYVSSVPGPVVPRTGQPNTLSLDFTPNQDNFTVGKLINGYDFSAFTIEASVNVDNLARYHGFVGKDGKPTGSPLAPLQLKLRDDNDRFQIEILDGSGAERSVLSTFAPVPGEWYHLAATNDGSTMSLYVKGPADSDYVLQGSTPVTGALFFSDASWTVGRGFFNGGITDWVDARIDEVRISETALSPGEFLFSPVPEPSAFVLAAVGGLIVVGRRFARKAVGPG